MRTKDGAYVVHYSSGMSSLTTGSKRGDVKMQSFIKGVMVRGLWIRVNSGLRYLRQKCRNTVAKRNLEAQ